ncbi:MAG: phosphoglucomutase, partial [Treponemataceae bacterium]|nr:phosphoglucomutase [Treponemataceae bacterium]
MIPLEHKMILSASGWRKVFAQSGNEQDFSREIGDENYALSVLAARAFAEYLREKKGILQPTIVVAKDTRPTGDEICRAILQALKSIEKICVRFLGVASA